MNPTRILLVDDDDLFAGMVRKFLDVSGYAVVRARNGKEALKLHDPAQFSLVVTDLIMPDMEGVELILALRKLNPAVKIIAQSGGGRNQPDTYLAIAQKAGAMRTLAKPFPLEELGKAVRECLNAGP
jgi:DNA-binding response OmpR family regulator